MNALTRAGGLLFLLSATTTQAAAVDAATDRIARGGVVAIGYRDSFKMPTDRLPN